ncbi:MAG: hypothetical protein HQ554_01300 [FCB group bacterium]|nr:hypothetical protein [FCB group bacterium]
MCKVIFSYSMSIIIVILNIGFSRVGAKYILRHYAVLLNRKTFLLLTLLGTGLILIAATGKLGWAIQSVGGKTTPERLNNFLFWAFSQVGVFVLFTEIWIKHLSKKEAGNLE